MSSHTFVSLPAEHPSTRASDAASMSRFRAEFAARHPERWRELRSDGQRREWLAVLFTQSRFLSEQLLRTPEWLWEISNLEGASSTGAIEARLRTFLGGEGERVTALSLARFRRKELLRIVLRDALEIASLEQVTEELSNLADAILAWALRSVSQELEARYGTPSALFSVLAVGKLGGRELNYSSDIDLIFLFSESGETAGPNAVSHQEFFKKLANGLTAMLSSHTAAGRCYRVDLRLRPEGALGEVALALPAAKQYYAKRARDWELQMLIKARVAAGDRATGGELLSFVEPLIYQSSIDFSTIETLSAARERISEKVARRQLLRGELDVKLAPGGIRDIEFLVQCLQRLHGGRETSLRHGGTLSALAELGAKDLLWETECTRLRNAYEFLRHLEHRLQLAEDRQVHTLARSGPKLERMARWMRGRVMAEGNSAGQLIETLYRHLGNVGAIYESIVHAQRPTPAYREGVADQTFASPDERSGAGNTAATQQRLGSFWDSLRRTPAMLKSLAESPRLGGDVSKLFDLSPYLAEQLLRCPQLLEEVRRATEQPEKRPAFEGLAAPSNNVHALRRCFQREMFRIEAGSVCLGEPVFQTLDRTSALAEFVIRRAYRMAREQGISQRRSAGTVRFAEPAGEMMVVALGRLGMREFDAGSDADLLFIIPDGETGRLDFWTRVAEHLIEILTGSRSEGIVLSIDTRLRPNGREGVLVQTESKYVEYFSTKAEAWEGIAYMKARGVAGDTERATGFLSELQQVDWRRWGQGGRSKQDLRQMRLKLQREQGTVTPLKAGKGGYYDADFILMYLRLKGAGLFFKSLNTPERIDVVEKMGHLERGDADFLRRATSFYRALDHGLRLVAGRPEAKLPNSGDDYGRLMELVRRWAGADVHSLEGELAALQGRMRQLFDAVFSS